MKITLNKASLNKSDVQVIAIEGIIDFSHIPELTQTVKKLFDLNKKSFVFDLGAVEYMDSAGLGEMLILFKKIREIEGDMLIVNPSERVSSVFELTRMSDVFDIFPNLEEALQSLQKD